MRNINWFRVNILSLPAEVLLFAIFQLLIRLDPSNCPDTGMCIDLPPTPFYFEFIYDVFLVLMTIIPFVAVISLGMLLYHKIRLRAGPHYGSILLAFVLTTPLFLYLLLMLGALFEKFLI